MHNVHFIVPIPFGSKIFNKVRFLLFFVNVSTVKKSKVYTDIAVRSLTCHTATGIHMPCRITQYYLPPDRGDNPRLYPSRSWYSI